MTRAATENPRAIEIQRFGLWEKIQGKRVPLSFELEATARCNNNCRHCYINRPAGDAAAEAAELTAAEILDIARQAVGLGSMWCLITGGEPLLREDFSEIYLGLKRLGLIVSVFTNATLITDELIALFKAYPPRDIEVTVYGITRETYDAVVRRPGAFDAFMRGLNRLFASGVRVRLKAMAIRSNLHEQEAIGAFCRSRTKDFFRFDPQLHLRFDGDPVRNAEIRKERLTPEEIVGLERTDEKRAEEMRKNCDSLIDERATHFACDHLFHCSAGNSGFSVSPDGVFRLCPALWAEGTTFDLRRGTLAEAWNDFVPNVRELRSRKAEFLDSCRKCALINLCLWCPAHAHLESGALDGATPYFCEVAHARAELVRGEGTIRQTKTPGRPRVIEIGGPGK